MNEEGPQLETLTRRLAECPAEFLEEPRGALGGGRVEVAAVVSDLLRDLGGEALTLKEATVFGYGPGRKAKGQRARLQLVLIACWLLHDAWFRKSKRHAGVLKLLTEGLTDLTALVQPEKFVSDADRREELVRLSLKALDLRPKGETLVQAQDRLATLNTVERARVIQEAKAAEERARKIREEMARKAAEEAASYYGRD
jgi:hypothetical protein